MRNISYIILTVLILLFISLFIVIPDKITIKQSLKVRVPERIIDEYLTSVKWHEWWQRNDNLSEDNRILRFTFREATITLSPHSYYTIAAHTSIRGTVIQGTIQFINITSDSTVVEWTSTIKNNKNPVKRLSHFIISKKAGEYEAELLNDLKSYLENEKNIYGISVNKTIVTDTLVLTTKRLSHRPPSNEDIYRLLEKMRKYISQNGAKETNKPIYNVSRISPTDYQTMVGIAIDRPLPKSDGLEIKRMVKANLLETEVLGGWNTVEHSFEQLGLYIADKKLNSPAIPFARLMTDRRAEPDTSKWITKVYYPLY